MRLGACEAGGAASRRRRRGASGCGRRRECSGRLADLVLVRAGQPWPLGCPPEARGGPPCSLPPGWPGCAQQQLGGGGTGQAWCRLRWVPAVEGPGAIAAAAPAERHAARCSHVFAEEWTPISPSGRPHSGYSTRMKDGPTTENSPNPTAMNERVCLAPVTTAARCRAVAAAPWAAWPPAPPCGGPQPHASGAVSASPSPQPAQQQYPRQKG